MRTMLAYASRSETGGKNGNPGDQDKKEVKIAPYYEFGQSVILRITDKKERHKISSYATAIAKNDNIGYSQSDRYSLYDILASGCKINDVKKKCNVDCSQMIASIFLRMGYKDFNKWTATTTLQRDFETCLKKHKVKYKVLKFKGQSQLYKGDILLNPKTHVVVVL